MTEKDISRLSNVIDNIATKFAISEESSLEKLLEEYLHKLLGLLVYPNSEIRNKVLLYLI
jgi:hypothetical protein